MPEQVKDILARLAKRRSYVGKVTVTFKTKPRVLINTKYHDYTGSIQLEKPADSRVCDYMLECLTFWINEGDVAGINIPDGEDELPWFMWNYLAN